MNITMESVKKKENWRHLALEIMVTTGETAPAMIRKVVGGSGPGQPPDDV